MGDGGTKKQGSFGNQKPSVTGLKQEMTINHILLKVAGKEQTCKCCVPRSASQWMTRYPRPCFLFQKRVSRTQADSCRQPLIQMEPVGQSEWSLVLNREERERDKNYVEIADSFSFPLPFRKSFCFQLPLLILYWIKYTVNLPVQMAQTSISPSWQLLQKPLLEPKSSFHCGWSALENMKQNWIGCILQLLMSLLSRYTNCQKW